MPPTAAPVAWPGAQARFASAKPQATSRPIRSDVSLSSDIAGAQKIPKAHAASTVTTASTGPCCGHGSAAVAIAEAISPIVIG